MSNLIVIAYDDMFKAEEVRTQFRKMQQSYLVALDDAVVATKDAEGKVKLHQMQNLTAIGAVSGGFWGTLIGMLFLSPLLGAAIGASAGAISGSLADAGINDDFMKKMASEFKNGSSMLFVLLRKETMDKMLEELAGTGGKVIQTSLTHEDEALLQQALDAEKAAG